MRTSKYDGRVGRKPPKEGSLAELRRAINNALKRRGEDADWWRKKYQYGKRH